MTVRVIHADCRDALCEIADASIDACVTDPPYALVSIGKRFGSDTAAPCKEGKTGAYARASRGFMGKKWDTGEVAFDPAMWREVLRVLKPGAHLLAFGGTRTYSAKADAEDRLGSKHPTVKPVDLIAYLIRLITPPGGTVLDPFAGSGTLGMACMREGFDAILIEREAEYIADIRRRINHVQGNDTPLFGGSTVSPPPARVVPSTDGSRTKDRPDGIAVMIEKEEAA